MKKGEKNAIPSLSDGFLQCPAEMSNGPRLVYGNIFLQRNIGILTTYQKMPLFEHKEKIQQAYKESWFQLGIS